MDKKPPVVGITGRAGSGKSYSTRLISTHFPTILLLDLDLIGHQVLTRPDIIAVLQEVFGAHICAPDGAIDRLVLGEIVFSDPLKLRQLNEIVHPRMVFHCRRAIADAKTPVVIAGALLHELALDTICDYVIVVDADDATILENTGLRVHRIWPHQRSRGDYIQFANIVIQNEFNSHFESVFLAAFRRGIGESVLPGKDA